jgi:hypothetical protein
MFIQSYYPTASGSRLLGQSQQGRLELGLCISD